MHVPRWLARAVAAVTLLTSGALVGIAVNAAAGTGTGFTDVPEDHPFRGEIEWLADQGISTGYPDNTFRGGEPVSRQAMAAFLNRFSATTHLVSNQADPMLGQEWHVAAGCAEDEQAVAGGVSIDDEDIFLASSAPQGPDWIVRIEVAGNVDRNPNPIEVWALCAPVPYQPS